MRTAAVGKSMLSAVMLLALGHFALAQTPTLTVDATGSPHPINPDIYGIANYGLDATFAKEIQVPAIRWGGDATTRYNWEVDSSNAGFDWYFMGGNGQTTPVPSASADLMINTYKTASNAHTLLTIPIIPYVNKSAAWSCSFPVQVYGAQQSTNPYVFPAGDTCGNSIAGTGNPDYANGAQISDTNIYANHIDNTVALQQGWIEHLIATFGTAADGGVPYYQLDNEPGGWSNTHRDVEPVQPEYSTIISLGQQYAAMIKATDPTAKVFGPVDFTEGGWIGTPSQQNNLFAGQYYLQQMAAYDTAHHQRILDYFDEHYYGDGTDDASELNSTRNLWDPTYYNANNWVDKWWFHGPLMVIPTFQNWVATYYPGTKVSISEYSFSLGTNPLVDALTEADVLGIFGRQGLDFASMWNTPKPTDPVAYSFRLYRNYDGAGGQFGNTAVNSTSTNQGSLSVYGAVRSGDGALTVIAINKTTSAISTSLKLSHFTPAATAAVYTYSNANLAQIVAGTPVAVTANTVSYNFPGYSATVFVFPSVAAPATMTSPVQGSKLTGSTATFNWSAGDGPTEYLLYVGTAPHSDNLALVRPTTALSATVTNLPTVGAPIYVTLFSLLNGTWVSQAYTYTEAGAPGPATMISPTPGSTLSGASATFTWTGNTGATQYLVYIGTTLRGDNLDQVRAGSSTSATVSNLPTNGKTIYVSLFSLVGKTWEEEAYTYTAASAP
jgi:hypothetical protein